MQRKNYFHSTNIYILNEIIILIQQIIYIFNELFAYSTKEFLSFNQLNIFIQRLN